jgi:hypothetical protein
VLAENGARRDAKSPQTWTFEGSDRCRFEMLVASLDKSSQVSPEQDWRAYQDVSDLIVSYSVRKSVRCAGRSHGLLTRPSVNLDLSVHSALYREALGEPMASQQARL